MKFKTILIVAFAFLLGNCGDKHFFSETVNINDNVWQINQNAVFNLNIEKPHDLYSVYISFKCTEDFLTDNLWLKINVKSPEGIVQSDTVMYLITDQNGKWFGEKSGKNIEYKFLYKSNVSFPQAGNYIFEISHLMRPEDLPYITEIGTAVDKTGKN